MKIDFKFWIFLLIFVLTQAGIMISLNLRLDSEFHEMVNILSDQVACMNGELDFCPKTKGGE